MSHSASAAAGGGRDNAGNKKGKRKVVNSWPSSDSETEQEKKTSRRHSSPFDSMASLETALPIKRGLSRNYDGKSKSFGNLTDLEFEDAKDMVKKEHAINKSRRLIIANEDYIHKNKSSSMPFPPSDDHKNEDGEDDDSKNQEEDGK